MLQIHDFVFENIKDVNISCHWDITKLVEEIKKANEKVAKFGDVEEISYEEAADLWEFYQIAISALFTSSTGCAIDEFDPDCKQLCYYLCEYVSYSDNDDAAKTMDFVKNTFDSMEFISMSVNN